MTRRWLFWLPAGAAMGQEAQAQPKRQRALNESDGEKIDLIMSATAGVIEKVTEIQSRLGIPNGLKKIRPANGECPICGTMAPKYVRGQVYCDFTCFPDESRRIDCDHCGNTFRQMAEDLK